MTTAELVARYSSETTAEIRRRVIARQAGFIPPETSAGKAVTQLAEDLTHHRANSLRASLTYLTWLVSGGDPDSEVPALAAIASQLSHHAALIHDDVVDASVRRNFRPTTWARYARQHHDEEWAVAYGQTVAVWLGDLLQVWAQDVFSEAFTACPRDAALRARETVARSMSEMWMAQHLDAVTAVEVNGPDRLLIAQTIVAHKAQYVASMPLQLGIDLAGGARDAEAAFMAFGNLVGEMYIILNDMEGVFGDPETMDSEPRDLSERRLCLLVEVARARASEHQRKILARAGSSNLSTGESDAIREVVVATGAKNSVQDMVTNLERQARSALAHPAIPTWTHPMLSAAVDACRSAYKIR